MKQTDQHERSPLISAPIGPTLTRMTIPTIFGIVAILMFNLVDTYFIGLLGGQELAAISFTFPVSFVVMNISLGIGIGTTAILSAKFGRGQHQQASAISTHAILLSVIIAIPIGVTGIELINPLFSLLGAKPDTLTFIHDYMFIWYAGIPFLYLPMIGNGAIRATGDTKSPSIIMAIAGLANGVLDPLLIFGIGPFPELGMKGAALATVISWVLASIAVMAVLVRKEHLLGRLTASYPIKQSWFAILKLGMPAGATNFMPPIAAAVITRIAAGFGEAAVAGYGVGTRIEAIALVIIIALSSSITPFVGQNYGAQRYDRIKHGLKLALGFTIVCELVITILLTFSATWLASIFNDEPDITDAITLFLWCLPISFGCQGMVMLICATLNAMHRPLIGTTITLARLFFLTIPLAFIGGHVFNLTGMFIGMAIANIIAGMTVLIWFGYRFNNLASQN